MASPALNHFGTEALKASVFTNAHADAAAEPSVRQIREFAEEEDSHYPLAAECPKFVQGALVAFGMEVVAAILLYGIWQLWHILR
jgi:hypothetical protein